MCARAYGCFVVVFVVWEVVYVIRSWDVDVGGNYVKFDFFCIWRGNWIVKMEFSFCCWFFDGEVIKIELFIFGEMFWCCGNVF